MFYSITMINSKNGQFTWIHISITGASWVLAICPVSPLSGFRVFSGLSTDCDTDLSLNILLCFYCFKLHCFIASLIPLSLSFAFSLIFTVASSSSPTLINVSPLTWHFVIRLGGFLLSTSMCVHVWNKATINLSVARASHSWRHCKLDSLWRTVNSIVFRWSLWNLATGHAARWLDIDIRL